MKHSEHEGVDGARGEYVTEFRPTPGMVFLIGGWQGAADLITLRGLKALEAADVILTDHLGPSSVLAALIDTTAKQVVDVSKLPYGRKVSQEKTNEMLVDFAREGKIVARLKGGDPFVFGRGFEEVQVLTQAGISVHVIPGVTSAISVPAARPLSRMKPPSAWTGRPFTWGQAPQPGTRIFRDSPWAGASSIR